ncbi:MAG: hypothetical protein IPG90_15990 [Bacteroidetes bacterium]|nr:hypothetical protein [Bacteroidota bacterium]MBK6839565.1 hypothetical protein [Bacteroidota bacterium]MBL0256352.1 hypothetical protein [Bacteroidota bacterium]
MNYLIECYYLIVSPSIQEKATATMKNLRRDSLLNMIMDFEYFVREL